jgi:hypothetical protein
MLHGYITMHGQQNIKFRNKVFNNILRLICDIESLIIYLVFSLLYGHSVAFSSVFCASSSLLPLEAE